METNLGSLSISKEELFRRLPREVGQSIADFSNSFIQAARKSKVRGSLVGVGGVITKPWPRKDIDTVAVLQRKKMDGSPFAIAKQEFAELEKLVERMGGYRVVSKIQPAIDEEFGTEAILKHDGSITLVDSKGIQYEIIRTPQTSMNQFLTGQNRPYVLLASM